MSDCGRHDFDASVIKCPVQDYSLIIACQDLAYASSDSVYTQHLQPAGVADPEVYAESRIQIFLSRSWIWIRIKEFKYF
jgi:hypothetical protein